MPLDGYFNANGEPTVQLESDGVTIELLVDTGFAGSLLIPDSLAGGLPLRFEGFEEFYTCNRTRICRACLFPANQLAWRADHHRCCCQSRHYGRSSGGTDAEQLPSNG